MGLMNAVKESLEVKRVKVLGVRTSEEAKGLAANGSAIYSLLIEYESGRRNLVEVNFNQMNQYLKYIDMDH